MQRFVRVLILGLILIVPSSAISGSTAAAPVNPNDYPSLSEKELGHLQWILQLAQQLPGDWSYMGGMEEGQGGLDAYRYQLGYMTYVLALAQYHKTPAYRELYQKAIDSLIQKMIRRDVWYYWEHTSKGSKMMNPALKELEPGWIDPVVEKNIMYSGHLFNMVQLYQMLSRDTKYDQLKSIVFKWQPAMEMLNAFYYDGNKLADVLHRQFIQNPVHMIECEINLVFPVCNQHPLLGLILYDHNHGTNLSMPVKDLMMGTFTGKKLLNPTTRDFVDFYMLEQQSPGGPGSPGNNACVGMVMHAWNPSLIEDLYRDHVKKVEKMSDGSIRVSSDMAVGVSSAPAFAAYAKELGDFETVKGITSWMEKNCLPIWLGDRYRYPRNDEKKIGTLFTIMAALAEMNVKDGIRKMYNEPLNEEFFKQPFISGVNPQQTAVKQAYYDKNNDLLLLTLLPRQSGARNAAFQVHQLSKSKDYSIRKDGQLLGYLRKGLLTPQKGAEFSSDGILKISTGFAKSQTFVIRAER
jgi:hypothetical protein